MQNYEKAEEFLLKTLEVDPKFEKAHYSLATGYYSTKNFQKAIDQLDKLTELNPKYKGAYEFKGLIKILQFFQDTYCITKISHVYFIYKFVGQFRGGADDWFNIHMYL